MSELDPFAMGGATGTEPDRELAPYDLRGEIIQMVFGLWGARTEGLIEKAAALAAYVEAETGTKWQWRRWAVLLAIRMVERADAEETIGLAKRLLDYQREAPTGSADA
jgi:hypothetical protein